MNSPGDCDGNFVNVDNIKVEKVELSFNKMEVPVESPKKKKKKRKKLKYVWMENVSLCPHACVKHC